VSSVLPARRKLLRPAKSEFEQLLNFISIKKNSCLSLIPHALERLPPKGSVTKADDEFPIEIEMEGQSCGGH